MNYIKDILSIQESNLAEIPVYNYTHDGKINYVIREMSIDLFMDRHKIENKDLLINSLKEFHNFYDNLIILKNNDNLLNEAAYQDIYNTLYLYEHVDVEEVKTLSKGYSIVNQIIDKTTSFIKGQHFDEAQNIRDYIMRIDTAIADLEHEKMLVHNINNDSYRFKASYFSNLSSKLILFANSAINGNVIGAGATAAMFVFGGSIDDIKNIYLASKDYNKLLDQYITKLNNTKSKLNNDLNRLEAKENIENDKS